MSNVGSGTQESSHSLSMHVLNSMGGGGENVLDLKQSTDAGNMMSHSMPSQMHHTRQAKQQHTSQKIDELIQFWKGVMERFVIKKAHISPPSNQEIGKSFFFSRTCTCCIKK
jgi:hypothetical protein